MNKKESFNKHTAVLSALFVMGDAIVIHPMVNTDENSFYGYALALGIFIVGIFAVTAVGNTVICAGTATVGKKLLSAAVLIPAAVLAFYSAAKTFGNYIMLVSDVMLKNTSVYVLAVGFGITVAYFLSKSQKNILKLALIMGIFSAATVLFFFLAGVGSYDITHTMIIRKPKISGVLEQTLSFLINPVIPALLLPFYNIFVFGSKKTRCCVKGVTAGYLLLGFFAASSVLLFGVGLSGDIKYPFSVAVATVTVGRIFTRLDGFSHFVFFICAAVKVTVCIFTGYCCMKELRRKLLKKPTAAVGEK